MPVPLPIGMGGGGFVPRRRAQEPPPHHVGGDWRFNPRFDLDWVGTRRTRRDALREAFRRTRTPISEFQITRWARGTNGGEFPVEWRAPNGAEVNMDFGHVTDGPPVPHVGYQMPGRRRSGQVFRGHILLGDVPANR
jgi:hypothetical protein